MKKLSLVIIGAFLAVNVSAQIFISKTCNIDFFSKTSMEDIDAVNKASTLILNTAKNELALKIPISNFKFKSALMEEHFNENYMETSKYPSASFKGKIQEVIDYKKDGNYNVTVKGIMNMHGVDYEETIKGTLVVDGEDIIITVKKHIIALKNYKIEIPKLVAQNIAETMEVNLNAALSPYVKK